MTGFELVCFSNNYCEMETSFTASRTRIVRSLVRVGLYQACVAPYQHEQNSEIEYFFQCKC
jgi:hypothetical protein